MVRNLAEGKRYFDILSNIVKSGEPLDYGIPLIKGAENIPLSEENFHPVEMKTSNKKVCFVDGGNNLIYLSPGHAIHLTRLYYSMFEGKKKVEQGRYTFIIDSRYDGMEYIANIYDMDNSEIYEDTMNIPEGEMDEREKIKGVGSHIRRIGEWLLIEKIMDKCDIVVKDGSLQTTEKGEYEYVDRIFEKKEGVVVGLSKTCTILTSTGYSLVGAIHHLSLKKGIRAPWYYYPIAKNIGTIKGDMFVVKLHPNASHTFRCEIAPPDNPGEIFEILASLSNDPIFPGYPYGLIDADVNARVSDEEIKLYRSIVYDSADKFSIIESNSMNAHDIISGVK